MLTTVSIGVMTSTPLENYGLIGDLRSCALVSRGGSIDWLCLPRFDSPAIFANLLGDESNGFWRIAPKTEIIDNHHVYIQRTLILQTYFETKTGVMLTTDFMPPHQHLSTLIRTVECIEGEVEVAMDLAVRFDYGKIIPWVKHHNKGLRMIVGPHALLFHSTVPTHGYQRTTKAHFRLTKSERASFSLIHYDSIDAPPDEVDIDTLHENTIKYWRTHLQQKAKVFGEYQDVVDRSIITLKALTYDPTGAIVAAPTTSLPEELGGSRNWDYRYCWIRDATFTLYALLIDNEKHEARKWRDWLLRAAAGDPSQLQTLYSVDGTRFLPEYELSHLSGYENSLPVRIGNGATQQFQLDVYGELMDAFYQFTFSGIQPRDDAWDFQLELLEFVEAHWKDPDEGIWEIRGPRQHFTFSKVMAWVAFDRGIKMIEKFGEKGPLTRWLRVREEIRQQVMERGFNAETGTFVSFYGSTLLDSSLLKLPLVGFIGANDPMMLRTRDAIRKRLTKNGLLLRYETDNNNVDGLSGNEGEFLVCTFWLVDNLVLSGEITEAKELFAHLLTLSNDLGLFSEEYDVVKQRMVGNFPQALTHIGVINTAWNLASYVSPARLRATQ